MADKLNKEFIKDPAAFIAKYPIEASPGLQSAKDDNVPGIRDFDFASDWLDITDHKSGKSKLIKSGRVTLRFWEERNKKTRVRSHRIRAFWLPWASSQNRTTWVTELGVADITLDRLDVKYFFTSPLGGCRIQIDPGPPCRVLHIAGDSEGSATKQGSIWRDNKAKKVLRDGYERSRRFSSTQEYDRDGIAFLLGFRTGVRWRFIAQGHMERVFETRKFFLRPVANDSDSLTHEIKL